MNSGPARPLVMVTASGWPSAMAANVECRMVRQTGDNAAGDHVVKGDSEGATVGAEDPADTQFSTERGGGTGPVDVERGG